MEAILKKVNLIKSGLHYYSYFLKCLLTRGCLDFNTCRGFYQWASLKCVVTCGNVSRCDASPPFPGQLEATQLAPHCPQDKGKTSKNLIMLN